VEDKVMTDAVTNVLLRAFELEEAGDIGAAISAFQEAASFGSTDAYSKLGTIFDDVLQPSQPLKAAEWYRRGVGAGDSSCAWNLAMHYCGLGDRKHYDEWLRIALKMGDPDAEAELLDERWWRKRNAAQSATE
jgi:hypothetical protein